MKSSSVQNTARKLLCGVLIGGMTAMAPMSHAAAESYRRFYPSSETRPYDSRSPWTAADPQRETADSSKTAWLDLALLGGLIYLMLSSTGGGGGSTDASDAWRRQGDPQPSSQGSSAQDNGIGCFWGYESTGTCIK